MLACSEAWRKGSSTAKPAASILKLLAALDELPAAALLNSGHALEGECLSHESDVYYMPNLLPFARAFVQQVVPSSMP